MPEISVIVPVYKVEKYLKRCVDSILRQTYTDFEIILVDDGSPDSCPEMCDAYAVSDSRIHVIHQQNGGLSAARNAGIEWAFGNSESEWIMFVDSDDWIHSSMLEIMLKANIDNNTDVSMCRICQVDSLTDDTDISEALIQKLPTEDAWCKERFQAVAVAKLYKKDCFKTVRFPIGKFHEDEYTTHKVLFEKNALSLVEHPLYFYFSNTEGIVRSSWTPRRMDVVSALIEQKDFFCINGFEIAYTHTARRLIDALSSSLVNADKLGYRKETEYLRKMLRAELKKHARLLNLSHKKDYYYYEAAYPARMKLYWYSEAVKRKLKHTK